MTTRSRGAAAIWRRFASIADDLAGLRGDDVSGVAVLCSKRTARRASAVAAILASRGVPNVREVTLAPSYQDSDLPEIAALLTGEREGRVAFVHFRHETARDARALRDLAASCARAGHVWAICGSGELAHLFAAGLDLATSFMPYGLSDDARFGIAISRAEARASTVRRAFVYARGRLLGPLRRAHALLRRQRSPSTRR